MTKTAHIRFDWRSLPWSALWQKLAPASGRRKCIHARGIWCRLRSKPLAVRIQDFWYCADICLEHALHGALRRASSAANHAPGPHRVPLGLVLLSRQQLTPEQLRSGLEAQRTAGRGRIGEWLQTLGYVSEQQVTAALARQWSCPVLRTQPMPPRCGHTPHIPATLLRAFAMVPIEYVQATATLHIACGDGIDYRMLYAIEQMLGCRTEPCLAAPSIVRRSLDEMPGDSEDREVLFSRVTDLAEFARIIRSYCVCVTASEIRIASCGVHVWVRLLRPSGIPLDLVLREPADTSLRTSAGSTSTAIAPAHRLPADWQQQRRSLCGPA